MQFRVGLWPQVLLVFVLHASAAWAESQNPTKTHLMWHLFPTRGGAGLSATLRF